MILMILINKLPLADVSRLYSATKGTYIYVYGSISYETNINERDCNERE